MSDDDDGTNKGKSIRDFFNAASTGKQSSKSLGTITARDLVKASPDKGICAAITACANEKITVVHPVQGQKEVDTLCKEAKRLRDEKHFEAAQEKGKEYREKLVALNDMRSNIQTLKNVILHAERALKLSDQAMEYVNSGRVA